MLNTLTRQIFEQQSRNERVRAAFAKQHPELADELGTYRDPWFGEIEICPAGNGVRFRSRKSPRLSGTLMRVADKVLVDWTDESISAESWLMFADDPSGTPTLTMVKVDPEEDFSYDYEDLAFSKVAECRDRVTSDR